MNLYSDDYFGRRKYTAAKIARKTAGFLVAGVLLGGLAHYSGETMDKQRASSIVSMFISLSDDGYCELPTNIVSSMNSSYKYVTGKKIVESLVEKNIKYCSILDEFYTKDGVDIIKITYSGLLKEQIDPIIIFNNGSDRMFVLNDGEVIEDGKVYRYYQGTTSRLFYLDGRVDIASYLIDNGISFNEIIDASIIHTKSFDEIIDKDLVIDVDPENMIDNNLYNGFLTLGKR